MDIGLPTSSPRGVNFMPSSPPTANGVQPWPEDLNEEFMDFVITRKNLMLLTASKCSDYQYYLNNHEVKSKNSDKTQRHHEANDKHWALKYFKLQNNQVGCLIT